MYETLKVARVSRSVVILSAKRERDRTDIGITSTADAAVTVCCVSVCLSAW